MGMVAPALTLGTQHRKTHYQRVMMFFVLMFLALQLIGAGSHNHAYTDHQPDCAACALADMPAGAPPPLAVVVPVAPVAGLSLAVQPSSDSIALPASYLTPPSHAPPGAAVFSF
jgi:hypothetical protein